MPEFVIDGLRLHYREAGSGPVLILLPGNTASSACHDREIEHFSARFRTLALDYRGVGRSQRCGGWTVDWWAQNGRDALALAEHLGADGVVLVGTSGGAAAALCAASERPEGVRAVIADSFVPYQPPETLRGEVTKRREKHPGAVQFWSGAHGADWEAVVEEDNRLLLALADAGGVFPGVRLEAIRCPVLFTAGLGDTLLHRVGEQVVEMTRQVQNGAALLATGGSHPLMWSKPDVFFRAADGFLAGV